jgi:hypothetical protein
MARRPYRPRSSRPGATKQALAALIEELLGPPYVCLPDDLQVNRGANRYNDIASWSGYAYNPELGSPGRGNYTGVVTVASWDTMTALVKHGSLSWVGKREPTGGEVTYGREK